MSTDHAAYECIGTLALALFVSDMEIRVSTLQKMLRDQGMHDGEKHGSAQVVCTASLYWENHLRMQQAIAAALTGQHDDGLLEELVLK